MKRLLAILFAVSLVIVLSACGTKTQSNKTAETNSFKTNTEKQEMIDKTTNETQEATGVNYPFEIITTKDPIKASIEVENYGTIELELYPEVAPISVSNFMYLANKGYYDGLIFHRVIEGFMIQGGCPEGTGMGGPSHQIKGEFLANGVVNELKHTKGVISMARSQMPNSAGSQFFIMHEDAPHLDGQYAAFGKVVKGQDIVDKIATTETDYSDRPTTDIVMKSVKVEQ